MKVANDKKYFLSGVIALVLAVPMMANAAIDNRPESTQSMTLNVSDLDLTQDEGIETLYARLKSNVDKVCVLKILTLPVLESARRKSRDITRSVQPSHWTAL